jgi:hypothetical protein
MLVDKYDVNEDRFISDTELLSHVRVPYPRNFPLPQPSPPAPFPAGYWPMGFCMLSRRSCSTKRRFLWMHAPPSPPLGQLEHLCMDHVTHVTSRMWSQPVRARFQSPYPPELPMHVPAASPAAAAHSSGPSAAPASRDRAMSPEVVRTVVISATGHSRHEGRSRSRGRSRPRCAGLRVCVQGCFMWVRPRV